MNPDTTPLYREMMEKAEIFTAFYILNYRKWIGCVVMQKYELQMCAGLYRKALHSARALGYTGKHGLPF